MTAIFYLLTLVLPLATVLIVFAMRYRALDGYRQLAESAAASQSQIAASLATMDASLAEVRARMAAVEAILKAVE
jgi:hypothetical protein